MPNWCDCELLVKGKSSRLKDFLDKVTDNEILDARKIIPYPSEFEKKDKEAEDWEKNHKYNPETRDDKCPKDGYNSGGYEWCNENWGTKWGFCHQDDPPIKTSRSLRFEFETAWSPPLPLILKLSEMFQDLHFKIKFWEGGMAFKGVAEYSKGIEISKIVTGYTGFRGG